jgi:hypothetical protein
MHTFLLPPQLDTLLYQLHSLSFFLSPSLWACSAASFPRCNAQSPVMSIPTVPCASGSSSSFSSIPLAYGITQRRGRRKGRRSSWTSLGWVCFLSLFTSTHWRPPYSSLCSFQDSTSVIGLVHRISPAFSLRQYPMKRRYATQTSPATSGHTPPTNGFAIRDSAPDPLLIDIYAVFRHSLRNTSPTPTNLDILDLRMTSLLMRLRNPPPLPISDPSLPLPITTSWGVPIPATIGMLMRARAQVRSRQRGDDVGGMRFDPTDVDDAGGLRGLPGSMNEDG